jgi:hypothetical protein
MSSELGKESRGKDRKESEKTAIERIEVQDSLPPG